MESEAAKNNISISSYNQRNVFIAQVMFRILAIAFTLIAISLMVTSSQSVLLFGIMFSAHYSYSSAFKFLLGTDGVVCGFSVLSLIVVGIIRRSRAQLKLYFLLLHDMVITVLMISGCAAGTAVGYVARYGEEKMGWIGVCDNVGKFCSRILISVVFSYLTFFSYLALTILSSLKLMTRRQPPR